MRWVDGSSNRPWQKNVQEWNMLYSKMAVLLGEYKGFAWRLSPEIFKRFLRHFNTSSFTPSLSQDTWRDILKPLSTLSSSYSPLPSVSVSAITLTPLPQHLGRILNRFFLSLFQIDISWSLISRGGTMGTFHHTEWYEKPQTLWMGSERQNKINKRVSLSDPEYWWQEPLWRATLAPQLQHVPFFSTTPSLLSGSWLSVKTLAACVLKCAKIFTQIIQQTEWSLLKREGGTFVCPHIAQTCRSMLKGNLDSSTCSVWKEIDLFVPSEQMGRWVSTYVVSRGLLLTLSVFPHVHFWDNTPSIIMQTPQ